MRSKIPLKWSLVILGATVIICFSAIIFFMISVLPVRTPYAGGSLLVGDQTAQNLGQTTPDLPARLVIPKINVDAAIEEVGLTAQGTMAVPAGPTDTAWFDLGPRPGEDGSAVIAGHEGWKDGIWAVFDDLHKLQIGDEVYVQSEQGATTAFVVSGIQTYDQNADASGVFSSSDGKAHLNLITCEGTWNAAQKSYSNRLVVFTDKE